MTRYCLLHGKAIKTNETSFWN